MFSKLKDFIKKHWKKLLAAVLAIISVVLFFMAVDVTSFSRLACSIVAGFFAAIAFFKK